MINKIWSLIILIFGICIIIYRKTFAANLIMSQNKYWGFHFGNREEKGTIIFAFLAGVIFAVVGILSLFDIIRFR